MEKSSRVRREVKIRDTSFNPKYIKADQEKQRFENKKYLDRKLKRLYNEEGVDYEPNEFGKRAPYSYNKPQRQNYERNDSREGFGNRGSSSYTSYGNSGRYNNEDDDDDDDDDYNTKRNMGFSKDEQEFESYADDLYMEQEEKEEMNRLQEEREKRRNRFKNIDADQKDKAKREVIKIQKEERDRSRDMWRRPMRTGETLEEKITFNKHVKGTIFKEEYDQYKLKKLMIEDRKAEKDKNIARRNELQEKRKKISKQYKKRHKNGQVVMKHRINHLLSKIKENEKK